ncbi:metacaspase-1-like [Lotus japonicus]|uniref:metacaspase-1-like n=1 Tax=Lotus japonicus TaxID=34305 RepID=UPI0025868804|nr:metacaspase-1-like [Lotus japonicus]
MDELKLKIEEKMDLKMSKKKKGEIISKTERDESKKKKGSMDLNMSKKKKKAKMDSRSKNAVLIGLKHPDPQKKIDIKGQILRMKNYLVKHGGFSQVDITLMIQEDNVNDDTNPTSQNIRDKLYWLVEYACPGDILFIHLIAHGCSHGLIRAPDGKHISDHYFRELIWTAVQKGCNLTFVSDCLTEPLERCPCPKIPIARINREERWNKIKEALFNPKLLKEATYVTGYYKMIVPTQLSSVDILTLKFDKTETSTEDSSPVILFTPFPNTATQPCKDESELLFPPPEGINHTSYPYGAFTNSILNVLEETHAPLTNLDLALKAMDKLRRETPPGLSCLHCNHAFASFVC